MKKVSTVVARQSSNCSRRTLTIGLDPGDRNGYYSVVNEVGELVLKQKITTLERRRRQSSPAKSLYAAFGAMPRSRIELEIGTHSPWINACRAT